MRAQPPAPGQLTKPSRLRDAPSRRVAEPNCQTAALHPTLRVRTKMVAPFVAEFVATRSAMAPSAIQHRAECWMPAAGYPLGAREAHASH